MGAPLKGADKKPSAKSVKRPFQRQTLFTEAEDEKIRWAVEETGLDMSSFLRFAALRYAKEVIG